MCLAPLSKRLLILRTSLFHADLRLVVFRAIYKIQHVIFIIMKNYYLQQVFAYVVEEWQNHHSHLMDSIRSWLRVIYNISSQCVLLPICLVGVWYVHAIWLISSYNNAKRFLWQRFILHTRSWFICKLVHLALIYLRDNRSILPDTSSKLSEKNGHIYKFSD